MRLEVLDAQGKAIIDSSHTRSKLLYYVCLFFVPAIVQVFFFGKRTVDIFFLFAWNLIFSHFQAPLPPKFFLTLISRICEFIEWDGYPGKGYSSC